MKRNYVHPQNTRSNVDKGKLRTSRALQQCITHSNDDSYSVLYRNEIKGVDE